MEIVVFVLALGLAMDAFAVSVSSGAAIHDLRFSHAVRIGLWFGVFQGIMPVVGWSIGREVVSIIAGYDHWVAFALLAVVGLKMIVESRRLDGQETPTFDPTKTQVLFVLAVATSIDALAVGFGLIVLGAGIVVPALIIGGVTFVVCVGGVLAGGRIGHLFERQIEVIGGIVLLAIGVKILFDHLFA